VFTGVALFREAFLPIDFSVAYHCSIALSTRQAMKIRPRIPALLSTLLYIHLVLTSLSTAYCTKPVGAHVAWAISYLSISLYLSCACQSTPHCMADGGKSSSSSMLRKPPVTHSPHEPQHQKIYSRLASSTPAPASPVDALLLPSHNNVVCENRTTLGVAVPPIAACCPVDLCTPSCNRKLHVD
jgi:hypothetical protein